MKPCDLRVLLVEDHDDSREAMCEWLRSRGCKVYAAPDVKTSVWLGDQKPFDVLLCDLRLPDGDGTEVISRLAAKKPFFGVSMSGYNGNVLSRTKAAGFNQHLTKPFSSDELESVLDSARHGLRKN